MKNRAFVRYTKNGKIVQIISYDGGGVFTCADMGTGETFYLKESDFLGDEKKVIKKVQSLVVEPKEELLQDGPGFELPQENEEFLVDTVEEPKFEIVEQPLEVPKEQPKKKKSKKVESQTITPSNFKDKYKQLEDL